ncbi:secretion protein HlyD [uncultured Marinobacter sp.]|jgi:HlyD family secretion protein|uniref:secretion protein HlyD n=1 Tax=uncultured Marinobacter sp. TaxID=187379 RepID=UPI000C090E7B|nr:secretion protein HlyD [Marinobacter sp.]MBI44458.1 secretion protein HlyD [Oceanospirillales bacterium]
MKKALLALLVLALLVASGYAWYRGQDADDGPLVLYGNVDVREVSLGFRQSGRVARLPVEEGDRVPAGQLLAELDDEPFQHAVAAARAQVAQAEAALARLEAGSRAQEIEQAREAQRQAAAVFASRELAYRRQRELSASGATSQQALDSARYALDEARAQWAAARATLSLLEEGARQEDIDAARAQRDLARAEAAQADTALADTRLIAPSDGVVLTRVVEPGTVVQAGTAVVSLALRDPVYVRAYVSEARLGEVPPGTEVTVTTDSSPRAYAGQVGFVSPRAEFTPKTVQTEALRTELVYRLRIRVPDADDQLLQGMPVTIRLGRP